MATVWVPALMRDLTGGATTVAVDGAKNVRQLIERLDTLHPGFKERLLKGNRLSPSVSVAVDGVVSRLGLLQPVGETSEVHFLPAVAGGW